MQSIDKQLFGFYNVTRTVVCENMYWMSVLLDSQYVIIVAWRSVIAAMETILR